MDAHPELQWRRDAIWAVVVIAAAALFLANAAGQVAESIERYRSGETPLEDRFDLAPLEPLEGYISAFLATGGLLFFLYGVALVLGVRVFPRAPDRPVTWTLWDVGKAAGAAYLGAMAVSSAARAVLRGDPGQAGVYETAINTTVLHAAILAMAAGYVLTTGGSLRALGFTGRGWLLNAVHGVLLYVAILPAFYLVIVLISVVLARVGYQPAPNPVIPALDEIRQAWVRWLLVGMITVFGPFTEEVFFRGYLYPAMRRRLAVAPALLINAALFSLVHVSLVQFVPIMMLGLAMGFLFERTRSIVGPATFHIVHNSFEMILFYYATSKA